jgi:hypothetical protein
VISIVRSDTEATRNDRRFEFRSKDALGSRVVRVAKWKCNDRRFEFRSKDALGSRVVRVAKWKCKVILVSEELELAYCMRGVGGLSQRGESR